MGLPVGARVLDVPCGQGRHAHLLAEAGLEVDGLDYSQHLLAVAKKRGTSPRLRYTQGDMRKLPGKWTGKFNAVVNVFTSFGFFANQSDDQTVIAEWARVLRPGGLLIWHGGSRDGVMARFLARDWWQTTDGTIVAHSRTFDPLSGILTIGSVLHRAKKPVVKRSHRIRLFAASQLAEMLNAAGLVVEESFNGFTMKPLTRTSSEMMLVARKAS